VKCPNCKAELLTSDYENRYCRNCGYPFPEAMHEKFTFYADLKNRLNSLNNIRNNFSDELEKLQAQALKFEGIISKDLEKLPAGEFSFKGVRPVEQTTTQSSSGEAEVKKEGEITETVPPVSKPPKKPINWEMLFGFNGFLILGVVSIIVGVGFFIRKAFISGYLGPVGKVSIIYLGAILSLGIGNFFRKKKLPDFGLALVGMGIALLYYSTYAGFQKYLIFNQYLAFSLMILITVFAVFLAIVDNNKWLAVLALIGGFSTPVMLNSGTEQNLPLFIYITILNIGLLAIAFYKRWNLLNNLGFIFTYLIFGFSYKYEQYWLSTIFLNIFFFIYSLVPFGYHMFRPEKEKVGNTWLIFINSFVALGLNYELMSRNQVTIEMLSIITLLYALNFTLMAAYMFNKGKQNDQSFIFIIGNAALFLIITIPIVFSKEVITIFWFAEALVLLWISTRLHGRRLIYGSYIVLCIALFKFFLIDYPDTFGLTDDFYFLPSYATLIYARYISAVFMIAVFYQFTVLLKKVPEEFGSVHQKFYKIFSITWIACLFIVANIETSAFFYDYFLEGRFVALSILWTLFAISLMFLGLRFNNSTVRKLSIGLFFATLAKVFFFDIANLGTSYKFVSFIVLGLVLILTSYLYRRFKDDLIETMAEKSETEI
jgi:uncharacterized membrane protein